MLIIKARAFLNIHIIPDINIIPEKFLSSFDDKKNKLLQDRSEETIKQEDYLQRIIEESCEASFKKVFSLRGVETQIIGGTTKYCGSGEVRLPRRGG